MKLYVESELPVDPETAWEIFESPEYRARLAAQTRIEQEVLEERKDGDALFRRVRTVPEVELPSMVSSILGASKLSYVQENEYDLAERRVEWTIKLDVMSDKVDVRGTTSIEAAPGGGSTRIVDGDIKVRVPLVGGRIEKAVAAEFEKSMRRAVDVALEMIEERDNLS